eukprot:974108-Pleurochrysis_carterae.AAC.1
MSGSTQTDACAESMNSGDLGKPRSAECSRMYVKPASRAAVRKAAVRRINSFASARAHARALRPVIRGGARDCARQEVLRRRRSAIEIAWTRRMSSTEAIRRLQRTHEPHSVAVDVGTPNSAKYYCVHPPPKAAIPSGRGKGPEKRRRTCRQRDAVPSKTWSAVRRSCGKECSAAAGKPGGSVGGAACGGTSAAVMPLEDEED